MTRQEEITLARMIDLRETLDEFEDKSLGQLKAAYGKAKDTVAAQLKKLANDKTAQRQGLEALLTELQAVQDAVVSTLYGTISEDIAMAGNFSYKKINDITSWDGRVENFNNVMLSPAQITQLVTEQTLNGKTLKDWIGSALAPDLEMIEAAIKEGSIIGDGYAATVRRIAKELTLDAKQLRDLETVVKTYNQSMAVKAQRDVYRANKEVVNQVEWSAILEGGNVKSGRGTCPRCIALDGMKWALEDTDVPNCPLHARCRCLLLPVTKTWRELGFDIDEMEKQYSPWFIKDENGNKIEKGRTDMSYHEWFASRDKAFQDRAIGPTRAELFRQGKLKLVEMVDQKGNLINVDKLGIVPSVKGSKPTGGTTPLPSSLPKAKPEPKAAPSPKKPRKTKVPLPDVKVDLSDTDFVPSSILVRRNISLSDYEKTLDRLPADQKAIIARFPKPQKITLADDGKAWYHSYTGQLQSDHDDREGHTLWHEYGHHIDYMAGGEDRGRMVALSTKKNSFKKALANDAELLGINGKKASERRPALLKIKEKLTQDKQYMTTRGMMRTSDLKHHSFASYSDIVDGMTNGEFFDQYYMRGHGGDYYRDKGTLEKEAFANLWAARAEPQCWELLKKDMPNTVAAFEKMLKEMLK